MAVEGGKLADEQEAQENLWESYKGAVGEGTRIAHTGKWYATKEEFYQQAGKPGFLLGVEAGRRYQRRADKLENFAAIYSNLGRAPSGVGTLLDAGLVAPDDLTPQELMAYQKAAEQASAVKEALPLRRTIIVTTRFPAIHHWADAPEDVRFLRNPHRHLFHVRVEVSVKHDDRELEFFLVKRLLDSQFKPPLGAVAVDLRGMSCEDIAKTYVWLLRKTYGEDRRIAAEVSEDGENGARIELEAGGAL